MSLNGLCQTEYVTLTVLNHIGCQIGQGMMHPHRLGGFEKKDSLRNTCPRLENCYRAIFLLSWALMLLPHRWKKKKKVASRRQTLANVWGKSEMNRQLLNWSPTTCPFIFSVQLKLWEILSGNVKHRLVCDTISTTIQKLQYKKKSIE